MRNTALFLAFAFTLLFNGAQAQWHSMNGPQGRYVRSILCTDSLYYAATTTALIGSSATTDSPHATQNASLPITTRFSLPLTKTFFAQPTAVSTGHLTLICTTITSSTYWFTTAHSLPRPTSKASTNPSTAPKENTSRALFPAMCAIPISWPTTTMPSSLPPISAASTVPSTTEPHGNRVTTA